MKVLVTEQGEQHNYTYKAIVKQLITVTLNCLPIKLKYLSNQ